MCQYKSMVISKELGILWLKDSDSHSDIVKFYKLKESLDLASRTYVSVEVTSKSMDKLLSTDLTDWEYKEDEEKSLPSWYAEEKEVYKDKCLQTMLEITEKTLKTGNLYGSLNLSGTQFKELPAGLTTIEGSLDISYTQIKELPAGLTTIGGYLDLKNTQIKELPEKLKVKGTIYK